MKFEIELTEEEAKRVSELNFGYSCNEKIQSQIRAQLPKEKKYKFLVGWIAPTGNCTSRGALNTSTEKTNFYSQKIYGFTEDGLVAFRLAALNDRHRPFDDKDIRAFVQRFLFTQEET